MGKKMLILAILCFMFTIDVYGEDIEIPRNTDVVEIPRTTISEEEKLVLHKIAVAEAGNTTPEMMYHKNNTCLFHSSISYSPLFILFSDLKSHLILYPLYY